MSTNFSQTAAYIWSLADLLRGDFKSQMEGFAKGIETGQYLPDETRARRNLPDLPNGLGKVPYMQGAMAPMATLPLGQAGYLDHALPPPRAPTVYARTGDWPVAVVLVVLLGLVAHLSAQRKVA